MIRRKIKTPTRRELLRPDYDLGVRQQTSPRFWIFFLLLSVAAAVGVTHHFSTSQQLKECQTPQIAEKEEPKTLVTANAVRDDQENAALDEQERAMNAELGRQVTEQAIEIKKLQEQIAFLRLMKTDKSNSR